MAKQDYYTTLGVTKDASGDDLKRAYRKLAMQYHPDRNPGDAVAEARFKELNEAYDVLKDDQKRAAYDRFGRAAFEAGGTQARSSRTTSGDPFGDLFDSLFSGMFGAQREFTQRRPEPEKPKTDIEKFNDLIREMRQPSTDRADLSRQAQVMLRQNSSLAAAVADGVVGLVERRGDELPVQKLFEALLDSNPNPVGVEHLSGLIRSIPPYYSKGDSYDKIAFCHAWAAETIIAKDASLATAQARSGKTIDVLVLEATQNCVDNPAVRKLFETTFLKAAPQAITDRWLYNWTRSLFYSHVFRGAGDLPPEHNRAWILGITRQALEKNPGLASIRVNSEAGASHTTVASYAIEAAKQFGNEPAVQELFNALPSKARPGMVGRWRVGLPLRYGRT